MRASNGKHGTASISRSTWVTMEGEEAIMPIVEVPAELFPAAVRNTVETLNALLREHGPDEALEVHESLELLDYPFAIVAVDDGDNGLERFTLLEHIEPRHADWPPGE